MLVALDYDGTYTLDPELWLMIIKLLKSRGHKVIVCTMRTREEALQMHQPLLTECAVYYTARVAKMVFLEKRGIKPDIWIDDNPMWLFMDAEKATPAAQVVNGLDEMGLGG